MEAPEEMFSPPKEERDYEDPSDLEEMFPNDGIDQAAFENLTGKLLNSKAIISKNEKRLIDAANTLSNSTDTGEVLGADVGPALQEVVIQRLIILAQQSELQQLVIDELRDEAQKRISELTEALEKKKSAGKRPVSARRNRPREKPLVAPSSASPNRKARAAWDTVVCRKPGRLFGTIKTDRELAPNPVASPSLSRTEPHMQLSSPWERLTRGYSCRPRPRSHEIAQKQKTAVRPVSSTPVENSVLKVSALLMKRRADKLQEGSLGAHVETAVQSEAPSSESVVEPPPPEEGPKEEEETPVKPEEEKPAAPQLIKNFLPPSNSNFVRRKKKRKSPEKPERPATKKEPIFTTMRKTRKKKSAVDAKKSETDLQLDAFDSEIQRLNEALLSHGARGEQAAKQAQPQAEKQPAQQKRKRQSVAWIKIQAALNEEEV